MPLSKKLPCLTVLALVLGALSVPATAAGPQLAPKPVSVEVEEGEPAAEEPVTDADAGEADAELDALLDVGAPASGAEGADGLKWNGYTELGAAYTYRDPERWSRLRARGELGVAGQLAPRARWKLSARAEADGAFDLEDEHYPAAVRRDRRTDFVLREAYVDLGHGDWEFRAGRQQIVWGEMVGFFFADVVSARDMRDFLQPELEGMRIGQWALRAEHFDLLITDIDMPRMDGIELVTLLRRDNRLQSMPVMVVSYKDREEDRRRGLDAGADYYLAKASFHDDALLDAVVELIGGAQT